MGCGSCKIDVVYVEEVGEGVEKLNLGVFMYVDFFFFGFVCDVLVV